MNPSPTPKRSEPRRASGVGSSLLPTSVGLRFNSPARRVPTADLHRGEAGRQVIVLRRAPRAPGQHAALVSWAVHDLRAITGVHITRGLGDECLLITVEGRPAGDLAAHLLREARVDLAVFAPDTAGAESLVIESRVPPELFIAAVRRGHQGLLALVTAS